MGGCNCTNGRQCDLLGAVIVLMGGSVMYWGAVIVPMGGSVICWGM